MRSVVRRGIERLSFYMVTASVDWKRSDRPWQESRGASSHSTCVPCLPHRGRRRGLCRPTLTSCGGGRRALPSLSPVVDTAATVRMEGGPRLSQVRDRPCRSPAGRGPTPRSTAAPSRPSGLDLPVTGIHPAREGERGGGLPAVYGRRTHQRRLLHRRTRSDDHIGAAPATGSATTATTSRAVIVSSAAWARYGNSRSPSSTERIEGASAGVGRRNAFHSVANSLRAENPRRRGRPAELVVSSACECRLAQQLAPFPGGVAEVEHHIGDRGPVEGGYGAGQCQAPVADRAAALERQVALVAEVGDEQAAVSAAAVDHDRLDRPGLDLETRVLGREILRISPVAPSGRPGSGSSTSVSRIGTPVYGPVTHGTVTPTDLIRRRYWPGQSRSNSASGTENSHAPAVCSCEQRHRVDRAPTKRAG